MQFPDDDNGQLLSEIAAAGVDLTQMHSIDFFILFEQKADAERFMSAISADELAPKTKLDTCPDTGVWEVVTSVTMVPDHQLLNQTEQYLESIANSHEGYGDGWGILAE
ncbi:MULTISPECIES: ribonuclease E inhibitor RraB [Pseudoalteromonas]|uniref:Ribonuclease E inhibitor RraB n=1 Tax=Pseudoalteromonas rubra TaxID=43658 RepID=A0A5S3UWC3_9GAMM|nr:MULTISPECIES: ribonuclease E inhibitor RraB [Pseudoalteromonas]MCG7564006.1 ribonuclease E inhibitor RraB [Pseudoalteromonas sp. McH1-42]MEC4087688.1 ribonuclease E inhibitor RraB [Pseudoalteromonas rubra]QPB84157.1 ribonuclease E inhibitor RraB [Pseudoalteromonas rubra]